MNDLPQLMDARTIKTELGLRTIDQAYKLMEKLPKYRLGSRVYVDRDDLLALLEQSKVDAQGKPMRKSA